MAIKIEPRARVSGSFQDAIRELYVNFLAGERERARYYSRGEEVYMKMRRNAQAHARSVLSQEHSDTRSGMEYELTRLRALPYTMFDTVTHGGQVYLQALTKPVVIEDAVGRKYDLGCYGVHVPVNQIKQQSVDGMHFIPMNSPRVWGRHPHHHAGTREAAHPLDMGSSTCWGGFGGTVSGLVSDLDIPELFRHLSMYLNRYNEYSVLGGNKVERLEWAVAL